MFARLSCGHSELLPMCVYSLQTRASVTPLYFATILLLSFSAPMTLSSDAVSREIPGSTTEHPYFDLLIVLCVLIQSVLLFAICRRRMTHRRVPSADQSRFDTCTDTNAVQQRQISSFWSRFLYTLGAISAAAFAVSLPICTIFDFDVPWRISVPQFRSAQLLTIQQQWSSGSDAWKYGYNIVRAFLSSISFWLSSVVTDVGHTFLLTAALLGGVLVVGIAVWDSACMQRELGASANELATLRAELRLQETKGGVVGKQPPDGDKHIEGSYSDEQSIKAKIGDADGFKSAADVAEPEAVDTVAGESVGVEEEERSGERQAIKIPHADSILSISSTEVCLSASLSLDHILSGRPRNVDFVASAALAPLRVPPPSPLQRKDGGEGDREGKREEGDREREEAHITAGESGVERKLEWPGISQPGSASVSAPNTARTIGTITTAASDMCLVSSAVSDVSAFSAVSCGVDGPDDETQSQRLTGREQSLSVPHSLSRTNTHTSAESVGFAGDVGDRGQGTGSAPSDSSVDMIANVAHDLKTPLSGFQTGVDHISDELADLLQLIDSSEVAAPARDPAHSEAWETAVGLVMAPSTVQQLRETIYSIRSDVASIRNMNLFMLMAINRCIEYSQSSRGIKLIPRNETVDLVEAVLMPINCIRRAQDKIQIDFVLPHCCPSPNMAELKERGEMDARASSHSLSPLSPMPASSVASISVAAGPQPLAQQLPQPSPVKDAHRSLSLEDKSGPGDFNADAMEPPSPAPSLSVQSCFSHLSDASSTAQLPLHSHIITDKHWLQENLLCLLSNAVKYSARGTVTVRLSLIRIHSASLAVLQPGSMSQSTSQSQSHTSLNQYPVGGMRPQSQEEEDGSSIGSAHTVVSPRTPASASSAPAPLQTQTQAGSTPTAAASINAAHRRRRQIMARRSNSISSVNSIGSTGSLGSLTDPALAAGGGLATSIAAEAQQAKAADMGIASLDRESISKAAAAEADAQSQLFLRVEVEDMGIGLSEKVMDKLFQPFQRAQKHAGGTGLGLYSLAMRVEALKGFFGVEARPSGQRGSIFWFELPYLPDIHVGGPLSGSVSPGNPATVNPTGARGDSTSAAARAGYVQSVLRAASSDSPGDHGEEDEEEEEEREESGGRGREEIGQERVRSALPTRAPLSFNPTEACGTSVVVTVANAASSTSNNCNYNYSRTGSIADGGKPSLRILIVDDSITIQRITKNTLVRKGHKVWVADNGSDAIDMVNKSKNRQRLQMERRLQTEPAARTRSNRCINIDSVDSANLGRFPSQDRVAGAAAAGVDLSAGAGGDGRGGAGNKEKRRPSAATTGKPPSRMFGISEEEAWAADSGRDTPFNTSTPDNSISGFFVPVPISVDGEADPAERARSGQAVTQPVEALSPTPALVLAQEQAQKQNEDPEQTSDEQSLLTSAKTQPKRQALLEETVSYESEDVDVSAITVSMRSSSSSSSATVRSAPGPAEIEHSKPELHRTGDSEGNAVIGSSRARSTVGTNTDLSVAVFSNAPASTTTSATSAAAVGGGGGGRGKSGVLGQIETGSGRQARENPLTLSRSASSFTSTIALAAAADTSAAIARNTAAAAAAAAPSPSLSYSESTVGTGSLSVGGDAADTSERSADDPAPPHPQLSLFPSTSTLSASTIASAGTTFDAFTSVGPASLSSSLSMSYLSSVSSSTSRFGTLSTSTSTSMSTSASFRPSTTVPSGGGVLRQATPSGDFVGDRKQVLASFRTSSSAHRSSSTSSGSVGEVAGGWREVGESNGPAIYRESVSSMSDSVTPTECQLRSAVEYQSVSIATAPSLSHNTAAASDSVSRVGGSTSTAGAHNRQQAGGAGSRQVYLYDVVLMDLQMPVMDGLEATRRIRQFEQELSLSRAGDSHSLSSLPAHPQQLGPPSSAHSQGGQLTPPETEKKAPGRDREGGSNGRENEVIPAGPQMKSGSRSEREKGGGEQERVGADHSPSQALLYHQMIIGLSANADEDTRRDALEAGMDAFMPKPFTMPVFLETCAKLGII